MSNHIELKVILRTQVYVKVSVADTVNSPLGRSNSVESVNVNLSESLRMKFRGH